MSHTMQVYTMGFHATPTLKEAYGSFKDGFKLGCFESDTTGALVLAGLTLNRLGHGKAGGWFVDKALLKMGKANSAGKVSANCVPIQVCCTAVPSQSRHACRAGAHVFLVEHNCATNGSRQISCMIRRLPLCRVVAHNPLPWVPVRCCHGCTDTHVVAMGACPPLPRLHWHTPRCHGHMPTVTTVALANMSLVVDVAPHRLQS